MKINDYYLYNEATAPTSNDYYFKNIVFDSVAVKDTKRYPYVYVPIQCSKCFTNSGYSAKCWFYIFKPWSGVLDYYVCKKCSHH